MILVGINHTTAPIEIRERAAFNDFQLKDALNALQAEFGDTGAVIISTCNRVEICCDGDNIEPNEIIKFIRKFHKIDNNDFNNYFYIRKDIDAFIHLATVAAGLDSMLIGETQIFGQIKKAYIFSLENGFSSKNINIIFQKINKIVKKVRTDTNICRGAVSVSFAAVELAKKIFESLDNIDVLLMGGGDVAELCALHLSNNGKTNVYITNRTIERSEQITKKFNGTVIDFDNKIEAMEKSDIIIVSTDAPHYLITPGIVEQIIKARKNNPIFFVDLSVPRNINPKISDIDNVFLYNVDDLNEIAETNKKSRMNDMINAKKIIEKYCSLYYN